tara:strand:- start:30 stop:203 length:174 start_codon:yes stop_codon:yes gene_type:complete
MKIISAKYCIDSITGKNVSIKTIIDTEEWQVPINENNRHYQAILEWVAEGNTIEEAD